LKRIIVLLRIMAVSISLFGCDSNKTRIPSGSAELPKAYYSIEELAEDSPAVIMGKVSGEAVKFDYEDVVFVKTTIKVLEVLRDNADLQPGDLITLLQTDMDENPLVTKDDQVLLFLKKHVGSIIENAYGIVGAGYGHFVIKNGMISPKESNLTPLIQTNDLTIANLKNVLETVDYIEPEYTITTEEEIEKGNQEERRLLEEKLKSDN